MERHQSRKPHVGFQTVCCQVQSEGSQPSSYWIYAKMLHVLHKTEQGKGVILVGGAEVDSATRVRRTHSLQRMVYIQAGPRKLQSWRPSWWKRSSGNLSISDGTLLPVTRSEGCSRWFSYILHFSRQEHYSQRIVDELYKRYVTGIYRGMAYKSSTEHLSRNR